MKNINLFEQDFVLEAKVFDKANELIDLLNQGLKGKNRYFGTGIYRHKDYYIFQANKIGEKPVFTIIDGQGNMPKNMEVNWRIWSCIVNNLNKS